MMLLYSCHKESAAVAAAAVAAAVVVCSSGGSSWYMESSQLLRKMEKAVLENERIHHEIHSCERVDALMVA